MNASIDEAVLAALLTALWIDESGNEEADTSGT